jgi:hypothetical protein
MIVQEQERWVYLGPPKTASTTMHIELVKPPWRGIRVDPEAQHDMEVPEPYRDFFVFGTVKNPYERAVSLYWHFLRDVRRIRAAEKGVTARTQLARLPLPHREFSMTRFLEMAIEGNLAVLEVPDNTFFCAPLTEWYQWTRVDAFIKAERLEEQFEALPFVNGRWSHFSWHNDLPRGLWRDWRTPRTIELVNTWAGYDFQEYGYARQSATA